MSDISMERVGEWLRPKDWELTGLATSEEEYSYLTENAYRVRHDFVVRAAQQALSEKEMSVVPDFGTADQEFFSSLPAKNVLGKDLHKKLADEVAPGVFNVAIQKWQQWTRLAERQATLGGFAMNASKYSDVYYQDEVIFDAAVERAHTLTDYPVRLLMRGVKFVQSAAVDMDTVATWVARQDPEATKGMDAPFWKVRKEELYWPEMLRIKQEHDRARGVSTFADLVTPIADGLYVAPYVPNEVVTSGNFIDLDDVHLAALQVGERARQASTAFSRVVGGVKHDAWRAGTLRDRNLYYNLERNYLEPNTSRSGVIFMSKGAVKAQLDHLRDETNARKVVAILEHALDDHSGSIQPHDADMCELDLRLVYGF